MRAAALLLTVGLALGVGAGPAAALELPTPAGQRELDRILLQQVGALPDRLLTSTVPGPVVNDEQVLVDLDGAGTPSRVRLEQRLTLTGTGDYQVRERGPARSAEALSDLPPPVTKFGAVVWQGFSPNRRELAARLTLDPALESARLPLRVELGGVPVGPGGLVGSAGTVRLRLSNTTGQPATLPTAADAPAQAIAAALDIARRAARMPGQRLPVAGAALPATVPTQGDARVQGEVGVPLLIAGTVLTQQRGAATGQAGAEVRPGGGPGPTSSGIPAPGASSSEKATLSGPGVTALPGGGRVAGTLAPGQSIELTLSLQTAASLALDLTVTPALDPRTLAPPDGEQTWAAWAAGDPDPAARRAALELLVQTAATGARATSYSPYLGADLPGSGSTSFRYALAPAPEQVLSAPALTPRPGPIAVAVAGLVVLLLGAGALWRAS